MAAACVGQGAPKHSSKRASLNHSSLSHLGATLAISASASAVQQHGSGAHDHCTLQPRQDLDAFIEMHALLLCCV